MIRGELWADETRCRGCQRLVAAAADLSRVEVPGGFDVLCVCRVCGTPTVVVWMREAA